MRFIKHWARVIEDFELHGQKGTVVRYGGSNESIEQATAAARRSAKQFVEQLRRGEFPDRYGYADRPVREEIIDTIGDPDRPTAIISRNGYGSLVLNTSRVFFADVDAPRKAKAGGLIVGLLSALFGGPELPETDAPYPKSIDSVIERDPTLGIRIYRTAAGFRCLVASRLFEAKSPVTAQLLDALGSDPLYKRLCGAQECFRARLTPKYWRCDATQPPCRFPWTGEAENAAMKKWEADYHRLCGSYAVCELIDSIGSDVLDPEAAAIIRLHDEMTIRNGMPLA